MRILIIEDDKEIRELLKDYLESHDYEVSEACDGNAASKLINEENYNLIIVDMMLPYKSGDKIIKELRESKDSTKNSTPVIVVSAKTMKDTRLGVLKMGADDYIVKPFDLDEVLVRIEVVLRRSNQAFSGEASALNILSYNGLKMNSDLNLITYNDKEIRLTSKEIKLLKLFLMNPLKTFSKANLYESVWEEEYCYDDNTINVHMSNLRNKLKAATGRDFIKTVWGIGYKFDDMDS